MSNFIRQASGAILSVALLLFSATTRAQDQTSSADAGQISDTLRSATYAEAIYPPGVMPDWDRGYVIHYEIEVNYSPETPMVVMYDNTGKRIREGRIWPQSAGSVRIRRIAATSGGAILAAGWAVMQDGSSPGYIVKTDLAGTTVQSLLTGSFMPEQICEAPDGTVWSLGRTLDPNDGQQHSTDILRRYSFEKGLLHSFLSEETAKAVLHSNRPWFSPFGSYVRCGKNKVSVYLKFTNEYVEIDTSSLKLSRRKLDEAVVQQREANGLAVTEDGRVYVSFRGRRLEGAPQVRGLYQIKAVSGNPIASLLPVAGTITTIEQGKAPPPGTFIMLWGADGNQLVVWRMGMNDSFLSWVNVIHSEGTD